jgi:pyroglutamyl-peptidase
MKALVTGFEPFGGERVNPSGEAIRRLPAALDGLAIATQLLPAAYAPALGLLHAAIARERPDIVLCTGEAGSRLDLTPERVAINVQDARIPDNDGAQPIDLPVVEAARRPISPPCRSSARCMRCARRGCRPRSPTAPAPSSATMCSTG